MCKDMLMIGMRNQSALQKCDGFVWRSHFVIGRCHIEFAHQMSGMDPQSQGVQGQRSLIHGIMSEYFAFPVQCFHGIEKRFVLIQCRPGVRSLRGAVLPGCFWPGRPGHPSLLIFCNNHAPGPVGPRITFMSPNSWYPLACRTLSSGWASIRCLTDFSVRSIRNNKLEIATRI